MTPSKENVIPGTKTMEASEEAAAKGAIVSLPGLSRCPWCNAECEMEEYPIAICTKDKAHIIEWTPWGG
jgi:hypothetical protein